MQLKKAALLALATKAGIDPESDAWKGVIGKDAPESDNELPAALFTDVSGKLLSLEAAKTHPEVNDAIKGKTLSVVDEQIKAALTAAGLDDAAQKALLDGKKTPDKTAAAIAEALRLGKLTTKATEDQREKDWQAKETGFQNEIKDFKTKYEQEQAGRQTDRRDYALAGFLGDKSKFKIREDMPGLGEFARMKLLSSIPADADLVVGTDGQPTLVMKADPAKPYHAPGSTTPLKLEDLAQTTLDQAGFLNKQIGKQDPPVHNQNFGGQGGQGGDNQDQQAAASFAANAELLAKSVATTP